MPIATALREALHEVNAGGQGRLVVSGARGTPLDPDAAGARASRAWRAASLRPITLHEATHTFASLMIAAGVNAKALATYMGHASVMITYDRYGHLMPGNEREAATLLDDYLARAAAQSDDSFG
ncbi:MAG: tyrosine-type recombinase/integrase [Actinobacteria bacterium]|nr:tyrosine-type recombinase/integrase [Actinomycetota bacterium]